jgi:hypothetical protein
LNEAPEALAAWGDSVYAIFASKPSGAAHESLRSVFTMSTRRFEDSDLWIDRPPDRVEMLPGLPGRGHLLGFAATEAGPCAVLLNDADSAIRLVALVAGQWQAVNVPAIPERELRQRLAFGLFAGREGVTLALLLPDGLLTWSGALEPAKSADARPLVSWKTEEIRPPGLDRLPAPIELLRVIGHWYAITRPEKGAIRILEIRKDALRDVASVPVAGGAGAAPGSAGRTDAGSRSYALASSDGSDRLVIISTDEREPSPSISPRAFVGSSGGKAITELSLLSGRVLFTGPVQPLNPLGSSGVRLLSLALILAMALILVLVLRPGDSAEVHLPEGYCFAEPMRRAIAGALDFAIVALLVPRLTHNSVLELVTTWQVWFDGEAFETLLLIALLGAAVGTIGEGLFGRTPGKLLTDCEVIALPRPGAEQNQPPQRIGLLASLTRNAIKWFLSPIAVLGLLDGSGRHRGDQFAKAAVVVQFDPAQTDEETVGPEE